MKVRAGLSADAIRQEPAGDLKITGELDVDLRSNIAAEARVKIVYAFSSLSALGLTDRLRPRP